MHFFHCLRNRGVRLVSIFTSFVALGSLVSAQSGLSLPENVLPQLSEQIDAAFDDSPELIIRRADAAVSLSDYEVAKSSRLPNLGGWAQFSKARDDRDYFVDSQTSDKLYYSLTLRQPLYHWGNIHRSIQNSRIRTEMDTGDSRLTYLFLARNIRLLYMELVIGKQRLERTRFAHKIHTDNLTEAREKRRQNQNSGADVFQAEIQMQRSDVALAEAEDNFWNGARVLARLTGADELTDDQVPYEIPLPDVSSDAPVLAGLLARFLSDEFPENTELQHSRMNLEIAENNLKNTKTSLLPRVDFVAGMTSDEQQFARQNDTLEFQSMYAGIGLTWNIFDGFATKARVRSSLNRLRAAEVRLEQEQSRLVDDVRLNGRQLKRLAMLVSLSERELKSARNQLDYTRDQASRGEASDSQIDSAKLGHWDALGRAMMNRHNYWVAVSEVLSLTETDPLLNLIPTEFG